MSSRSCSRRSSDAQRVEAGGAEESRSRTRNPECTIDGGEELIASIIRVLNHYVMKHALLKIYPIQSGRATTSNPSSIQKMYI